MKPGADFANQLAKSTKCKIIKGSSINDVTVLVGGGGQGFCDDSTKTLVVKRVTMEGGVSKIVQNCVTSFMDNPLAYSVVLFNQHLF